MAAGDALIETAKDAPHLLAAMRKVREVADEFDTEDAHVPAQPGQAPISRGDRARHAIPTGLFTGMPRRPGPPPGRAARAPGRPHHDGQDALHPDHRHGDAIAVPGTGRPAREPSPRRLENPRMTSDPRPGPAR